MLPAYFSDVYKKHPNEKIPTGVELMNNTDYPNTNSIEYRQTPVERTVKINSVWETIAVNNEKQILIGTNKCSGREWCSSLWGFERIDNLNEKSSVFRLQVTELITKMCFLSNNMFLAAFRNGAVELWSTYSKVRNPKQPYCLFLIAKNYEHKSSIECLEPMEPSTNRAISGGQDFTLKIWDWSEEELQSSHTYHYAHIDTITGISHLKSNDAIFATCSRDRSVLQWDLRLVKPAQALYTNHICSFQGITWLDSLNNANENLIYVGDVVGNLHAIDQRASKSLLFSKKLFDHSIRNVVCNGNNLALIADTNTVKVYSAKVGKEIYRNDSHTHFVRDCVWYNASKLLTVGCDSKLTEHDIKN